MHDKLAHWRQTIFPEDHHYGADAPSDDLHILQKRYGQCIDKMQYVLEQLRHGDRLDKIDVATIASGLYEDRESYLKMIHRLEELNPLEELNLSQSRESDQDRFAAVHHDARFCTRLLSVHCVNVALYSLIIAMWGRLSDYQKKTVLIAALLHDIGKVGISETILNKPAKLNYQEFTVIQQHPCIGYDIACQAEFLDERICDSILMHHERMDGKGYPKGLKENTIGDEAKIIAIADTFDAITSDHVYKCKSTPFEALSILKGMQGNRLDTRLTREFLYLMTDGYMGAFVLLSTGDTGEIVFISPATPNEPILRIGKKIFDLSQEKHMRVLALLRNI